MNMRLVLLAGIAVMLLSIHLCLRQDQIREKERIESIKPGMARRDVLQNLGKPDYISSGYNSEYEYYYYFTKNKFGRSEMPYVQFDSSRRVVLATYAEGG